MDQRGIEAGPGRPELRPPEGGGGGGGGSCELIGRPCYGAVTTTRSHSGDAGADHGAFVVVPIRRGRVLHRYGAGR